MKTLTLVVSAVVLWAHPALTQNLVVDGDFDGVTLDAWSVVSGGWSVTTEDVNGDPASGSAEGEVTFEFGAMLFQCIPVEENQLGAALLQRSA